jgi:pimeloyl-ACP methyl ester carboxylesterase
LSVPLEADEVGEGPAVVLLHGQPGSRADWSRVATRLRGCFRVITPDRPGYGSTGGPARGLVDNADAVASLLDRLEIDAATVAGHSWGGGVALLLAHRHPERVRGLVLISSVGPQFRPSPLDHLLALPGVGPLVTLGGLRLVSRALLLPHLRRVFGNDVAALDDDGIRQLVQTLQRPGVWRSIVREERALFEEAALLVDAVAGVRTPTTVVQGEIDSIVPAAWGRGLARDVRDGRLIEIPGVGHVVPVEAPEVVAAAVAQTARVAAVRT